jgi:two-component system, sensor histidine kinase YcbA
VSKGGLFINPFAQFIKYKHFLLILVFAAIVAIAGEFKIYPFGSDYFRFSLGPIVFSFIVLISNINIVSLSILTTIFVVLLRTLLSISLIDSALLEIVLFHLPAGLFYIIFGLCLQQLSIRRFRDIPFTLWLFMALFELIANLVQTFAITLFVQPQKILLSDILFIVSVASIRSFFVVGIYTSIIFTQHKQKIQQMLKLHSDLYTETMYMQQTITLVERVTKDHFLLYKGLQQKQDPLSFEALRISSELHEVKKNTQRAVAGLSNLIIYNEETSYTVHQLIQYVKVTQMHYAHFLNKSITFTLVGTSYYKTKKYLPLLSILNNIISNAVEAIEHVGFIQIEVKELEHEIIFTISNNGHAILESDIALLFEPGYTTKYDVQGNASTGIGLYHVNTIVNQFGGSVEVESNSITTFKVNLKKQKL